MTVGTPPHQPRNFLAPALRLFVIVALVIAPAAYIYVSVFKHREFVLKVYKLWETYQGIKSGSGMNRSLGIIIYTILHIIFPITSIVLLAWRGHCLRQRFRTAATLLPVGEPASIRLLFGPLLLVLSYHASTMVLFLAIFRWLMDFDIFYDSYFELTYGIPVWGFSALTLKASILAMGGLGIFGMAAAITRKPHWIAAACLASILHIALVVALHCRYVPFLDEYGHPECYLIFCSAYAPLALAQIVIAGHHCTPGQWIGATAVAISFFVFNAAIIEFHPESSPMRLFAQWMIPLVILAFLFHRITKTSRAGHILLREFK